LKEPIPVIVVRRRSTLPVTLLAGTGQGWARQHPPRRDGEAAGEHLPDDQHRPGLSLEIEAIRHRGARHDLAGNINGNKPRFVVSKIQNVLNNHGKAVHGGSIHILGIAPISTRSTICGNRLTSQNARSSAEKADCCVIITDHSNLDYKVLDSANLIVDTRNALRGFESDEIVRL